MCEADADGKHYNTHVLIGPDGKLIGKNHKIWLTAEKGHTEAGKRHDVFEVKGLKVGIAICADGSKFENLEALAKNGAQLIYAPHCNSTGSTIAKWYTFRAKWGGADGWIAKLKVHAALHNNAGRFAPEFDPPAGKHRAERWASGAWFIGPDGKTLAQMKPSTNRADSKEFILIQDVPLPAKK
jgi:predicted amidohydrolase